MSTGIRRLQAAGLNRTLGMALAAGVFASVLTLAGCTYTGPFSDAWSRGQIDIVVMFTQGLQDPDWPYFNDMVDLTSQTCGEGVDCVQAVGNDYFNLLKFKTLGQARVYTESLGEDGAQIDPLVVHFTNASLTQAERDDIVDLLSDIYVSSPD